MSTIETLMVTMIATVAAPIMAMLTPSTRIFCLYVGSAAILALLVYRRAQKKRREEDAGPSIGGFFHWCAPRRIYGHASARVDYRFYALSMMFYALGLIPIAVTAPSIAAGTNETLGLILGTNTASGNEPGLTIKALYTLSVLIAFDAGTFLAHLLVHKVPILWEFHKVHHSAQVLTPITAYRSHPVDVMVAGAFVATTTGIVGGAFAWANAARVDEMLVLGLNAGLFAFYLPRIQPAPQPHLARVPKMAVMGADKPRATPDPPQPRARALRHEPRVHVLVVESDGGNALRATDARKARVRDRTRRRRRLRQRDRAVLRSVQEDRNEDSKGNDIDG